MRRTKLLFIILLLVGSVVGVAGKSSSRSDSLEVFWQKFKAAVTTGNKLGVAALTKFPLGMSYGIPSIKNRAAFVRRYREVFNEQADAVKCFATAKPEKDPARPREFTVACPDAAGNEVVIYHFERTRLGWKFVALDNINE